MKNLIRKIFKLRKGVGINFYITDFFFRKILRRNSKVTWAIHHTSTIFSPEKIERGKDVYPGDSPGNFIDGYNGIIIGDFTNIGPNVGLISANHDLLDNKVMLKASPIRIGKCCWIGMNVVVLPEIVLGDFTIVGANSVVTKSFSEGYCVIAGNPAKVIKQLDKASCDQFVQKRD
jgi:serine acetyltransferase